MSKLFIIRNQNGQYLSKQQEWLDGGDRNLLYRTVHRDEAINTVFEVSSRDIYLRAEALACDADARGNPVLGEGAVSARELERETETNIDNTIAPAVDDVGPSHAEGGSETADSAEAITDADDSASPAASDASESSSNSAEPVIEALTVIDDETAT